MLKKHSRSPSLLACATALIVFCTVSSAQSQSFTDGFLRDAEAYAAYFNVDLDEAKRRLVLQHEAGALDERLTQEAAETFGGLWIDHEPEFKITVSSTDADMLRPLLRKNLRKDLARLVKVEAASVTQAELLAQQDTVRTFLQTTGLKADLSIDIRTGAVVIESDDSARLAATMAEQRFTLPARVRTQQVESLAEPDALLRGGRHLRTCTAGFTVRTPTGRLGIATAGHCNNSQHFENSSNPLTFQAEHYAGSHDVQWHSGTCSDTVSNEVFDGTAFRTVTGSVGRDSQAVGTFVCKHGNTTGHTCGIIWGRNYCPSYVPRGRSTFITVIGNGNLADSGDSGGPWFVGDKAYGIHSGSTGGGAAIYMAANWMATVGYPVLNYAAGNNPWVSLSCSASSSSFQCTARGNSGASPYTFSNWSYWGPASSWSSSGSSMSGSFGFPNCSAGQFNAVQVRITDACGRTSWGGAEFYCPEEGQDPFCDQTMICDSEF